MPYNLENWISKNESKIIENGRKTPSQGFDIFSPNDFNEGAENKGLHVTFYGPGTYEDGLQGDFEKGDHWIWCKSACGKVVYDGNEHGLIVGDTKLIPIGKKVEKFVIDSGLAMVIHMPRRIV